MTKSLNPFTTEWRKTEMPNSVYFPNQITNQIEPITIIEAAEGYKIELSGNQYRYVKTQPTILETIALIMAADKKPIHVEPLQGEESRIDLSTKNKE